MSDVTRILEQIESGDASASENLLPLVYEELRKLASARISNEKPGQTLQPTALVHEAYLRLVDVDKAQKWNSRGHFFSAAAEAMRRILVERARHKGTWKAGGRAQRFELSDIDPAVSGQSTDIVALDEALDRLSVEDPRAAELVKLRFFGGQTVREAAELLEVSVATAENDWAYAKSWLAIQLTDEESA